MSGTSGGTALPAPCLVVLVGPAGSGKSTWAAEQFRAEQVVSSDRLRAVVGEGEDDLAASTDALAVLDDIVSRRAARRLTTVIDTLGFDADRRAAWRDLAQRHGLATVCVAFDTPAAQCRAWNKARAKAVPADVLTKQVRAYAALRPAIDAEGFDVVTGPVPVRLVPRDMAAAGGLAAAQAEHPLSLRFGLQIPEWTWTGGAPELRERLRAIALAAEEAGFDSLWVMDHFRQIPLFGPAWGDMLESYTTLGFLAAVTERMRLGAMVTGITYRNVAHLAKIVATLDVLSGGRAVCGLGVAWFADEHRAYGWPFPTLGERYALLEDTLRLLPLMWGPGSPPFAGRIVSVPEAMCYPRPVQERVPLLVGGGGERRTLRLVAQYADACNIVGEAPVVRRKLGALHSHCATLERDPAAIEVTQLSTTLVGRDAAEVAGLVTRLKPRRMGAERYASSVHAGTVVDQIGRFRELAEAGVQAAVVSLPGLGDVEPIERFAPVIEAFAR